MHLFFGGETILELARQEMRKLALDNFKHIRTCVLTRELCLLLCTSRPFLNAEDVCDRCSFISKLCMEAGCRKASDLCAEAAETVMNDEKTHLELCEQSCMLCHEGRFPGEPQAEKAPYIT